jgi:hypothetical protein
MLEELGALCILSEENIMAFELIHLANNKKNNAYNFYKIFSKMPLDKAANDTGRSLGRPYPCDKLLPYGFISYAQADRFETNPNLTLSEYFDGLIDDLKGELKGLDDILKSFVDDTNLLCANKEIFTDEQLRKERIKVIIKEILGDKYLQSEQTFNTLIDDFKNRPNEILTYAPLIFISDKFFWQNLEKWPKVENKKKKNTIFDRLHAEVALSYCDCFITNDKKAQQNSIDIIKVLNLDIKVGRFNPKNCDIEWVYSEK